MSKINDKLGLKPARKRQATKSSRLAAREACPSCGGHHVLRTESVNGMKSGAFWCVQCETFFGATT